MKRDSKTTALVEQIHKAATKLRARAHNRPVRVRIHPLDMQLLERKFGAVNLVKIDLLGTPVEIDCAVTRGKPVAEYEQKKEKKK